MGKTELYNIIKFLRIFSVSDDDDSDFFSVDLLACVHSSNMCGTWQSENGMCLSTKNLHDPQKLITGNGRVAQFFATYEEPVGHTAISHLWNDSIYPFMGIGKQMILNIHFVTCKWEKNSLCSGPTNKALDD